MLIKLFNKITNMIKRAIITNVDKTTKMYRLQTKIHSSIRNATMLMPYGLICDPVVNSEGLTFSVSGDGSRMYCMPFNPNLFPSTEKGDVILYSNKTTTITLKQNGNIEINTTKDVSTTCSNLTATVSGDISASCSNASISCTNLTATAGTQADITAPIINLTGNTSVTGIFNVIGSYQIGGVPGATGSFTTTDGKTVTVTSGIITAIV